jgi:hypothetical protein
MIKEPAFLEGPDFSLVLGGQFLRKSHLAGDHLELLHRRLLIITLVAWVPLLILALLGSWAGTAGQLSFLHDIEVHAIPCCTSGSGCCRTDCSRADAPRHL